MKRHITCFLRFATFALVAWATLLASPTEAQPATPAPADPVRQWGMEGMRRLDSAFWLPASNLYADEITTGTPPIAGQPAFLWGGGIMLSALNAAARLDRTTYLPEVRRYISALDVYWVKAKGLEGYQVLPSPNPPDRYYDDNEWIVLDLADSYDLTHDPNILERAKATFRFVMSGPDDKLGGGLYWHEGDLKSKNTCSNAPALVSALRLYQITHDRSYLAVAYKLYAWTNEHLQDADGLFFDSIGVDGRLHSEKYSYNSALMIRANTLLFQLTHDTRYLAEARRIARASEAHWVRADTGAIADDAAFAHLLSEAFLFLYNQDHDPHHLTVVSRALQFLHDTGRDTSGDYTSHWDRPRQPGGKVGIKAEAAAARAFLTAAPYFLEFGPGK